jgi:hypothetical protein
MTTQSRPVPIYTTKGDVDAYLVYPHLFNRRGEWCGWVSKEKEVFSVHGAYVGWLDSAGPRILRKRSDDYMHPRRDPPSIPKTHFMFPATTPLAPMMKELSFDTVDVLEEWPDLLPTVDAGEYRPDME